MRDLIPDTLRRQIRDRYLAGVADAQDMYHFSAADEDSLTGALGQAISMARPMIYEENGNRYIWQITYQKLRGRGPGAPEKSLGADGVFEIGLFDVNGETIRQKGLPFQAMKNWSKPASSLLKQTHDMLGAVGQGLIVDFSADNYSALPASAVIQAEGRAAAMRSSEQRRGLGHVLGDQFLDCEIGTIGLRYDAEQEVFRTEDDYTIVAATVIDTKIAKLSTEELKTQPR